jgi:hypothetical protein
MILINEDYISICYSVALKHTFRNIFLPNSMVFYLLSLKKGMKIRKKSVNLNMSVFQYVAPCSMVEIN